MGAQKTPIQKTYEVNTGQDFLKIQNFQVRIDNLTRLKYLQSTIKMTNTPPYMIATMLNQLQKQ